MDYQSGKQMKTSRLNNSGFTVVELAASLAIFAILAAIAIQRFVAFQPYMRLNGAAREVFVQLMWARAKAVEHNNRFLVSFPTNHSLNILDDKNNNGVADTGESITAVNFQTDYSDATVSKGAGDPDPTFYARGTAGGSTTITVANAAGSRIVTVYSTGIININ
jgi:prepilin-type N-terminal cleavage/methylation domain-containing protein